ncbi:MAG: NAD(P)H-hydrate dehydratase [Chloroflexi bacterium]|nr:NAD(P)H-hydrate dehydratase [Chloroflexota bacterium]
MKLVSVSEMHAIEQEADANGLTYDLMMENAGHNLADEVMELAYYQDDEEEVQALGLVGPGNNGGDTLVALARLAEKGWTTRAYLVKRKAEKDPLAKRLEDADGEIYLADEDAGFHQLQAFLETADVVLDGLLGTGFNLPLKEELGSVLAAAQGVLEEMEWPPLVVAVDCPSGVDCDTGKAAPQTIPADATVTMAAVKRGLLTLPAYELTGEVRVVSIGSLDNLKSWQSITNDVADSSLVSAFMPNRPADAHKGMFGTAFIAAGSLNYTGAALLAGKSAARIGAGLVTLAIPAPLHTALAGHFPEATWILLPHEMGVLSAAAADVLAKNLERATALLVGPGLGLEETTREFIEKLLAGKAAVKSDGRRIGFIQSETKKEETASEKGLPPLVFDADGLKLLAKIKGWPKLLPAPAILTPHPGEMSALTGLSVDEIQKDRQAVARKYAVEWGHVVVLKGAFTVIAAPDGRTTTIPYATPALAHAGTGDVLAGLIAGLRAQGVDAYAAAIAGAWIHAQAGEAASEVQGNAAAVLAGDVLDCVADVLSEL